MKAITLLLIFSLFSFQDLFSQDWDKTKLERYFDLIEGEDRAMGSVMLMQNGEVVYYRNFGYADREQKQAIDQESKFRTGSISKTFTSTLIFKTIEEGKLDLGQSIDKFFPELEKADEITISDLLNHRSGIFSLTSQPDYLSWNTEPKNREDLYSIILKGRRVFEPGSKAEYSNSNYVLLTWVLEDIYQKPYSELLAKIISKPLGLENTYVGKAFSPENGEVNSYKFPGKWIQESITDMSIPLGAGAVVSTPQDLSHFIRSLMQGKIISEESLSSMTEIKDNYGRGIFKIPFYEDFAFGHDGGIDGFRSNLSYFPERDLAYCLTLNGVSFDPNQISIAVLSAFFGKEFELPVFKDISLTEEELDKMAGTYAAPGFPLDITIRREHMSLMAQATGQPEFPLEYEEDNKFVFKMANLSLEFFPETEEMSFEQGPLKFMMKKKE
ncbi:MAG: serine hydrolase domain-containing protein [Cecembia sp.]